MSRHRPLTRGTILGSRASQWFVRTVAAVLLLGAMTVGAPRLGITILSPSQWIDRFLAWNHTFPTLGAADPAIYEPFPSMSPDILWTVIVWVVTLYIIGGMVATVIAASRTGTPRRRVSTPDDSGGES
jgi:hypothetical protein